jgi:hypothetical protein
MKSPEKDNNLPLQNLQKLSCLSSSPLNFNRYLLRLHVASFTCLLQYLIRLYFISYTSMLLKMHKWLTHILLPMCRRFDPGGSLDRRVNCRRVSQPRWVGARRSTEGGKHGDGCKGETRGLRVCPAPRSGALAVGGYKRPRGREREACTRRPVLSARPIFSYESPGPSFYRRKERVQVYNGGCSSVLTCLAERS